jgi:hypothetical protein
MDGCRSGERLWLERFFDWLNVLPVWGKLLVMPVVLPILLVYSTAALLLLFLLLPFLIAKGQWENHKFWRRLRQDGRVALWAEVAPRVSSGEGTLIVEVGPKGPGWSWWIDRPRDEIDPDHVVPSWQDVEERGWRALEPAAAFESLNRWTVERLGAYESLARTVVMSWGQLTGLTPEAKRQSVVAVPWLCEGCLTGRWARRASPKAAK